MLDLEIDIDEYLHSPAQRSTRTRVLDCLLHRDVWRKMLPQQVWASMQFLIAARALQGVGDGGIQSLTQNILSDLIPRRERGSFNGLIVKSFQGVCVIKLRYARRGDCMSV